MAATQAGWKQYLLEAIGDVAHVPEEPFGGSLAPVNNEAGPIGLWSGLPATARW